MSELQAEVERVLPLCKAQNGSTFWWSLKLKGRPEDFALHNNGYALFGPFKAGDKVQYVISKAKLGKDGTQGIDRQGWLLFDKLRKVEEEKKEWEEAKPEL